MYHPAAALHQQVYRQPLLDDFRTAVPAALQQARQLTAQPGAPEAKGTREGEPPPEQLTLF
jgi:hypothetical protein